MPARSGIPTILSGMQSRSSISRSVPTRRDSIDRSHSRTACRSSCVPFVRKMKHYGTLSWRIVRSRRSIPASAMRSKGRITRWPLGSVSSITIVRWRSSRRSRTTQGRKIIGVGRLVADPGHEVAEYAVLVADPWQGQGLGLALTDDCLEIAKAWGLKKVFATTERINSRMLATFRRLAFELTDDREENVVVATKSISSAGAERVQA